MNDVMHIKSGELGNRAEMPTLSYEKEKGGELGFRSDEEALYIGTKSGNLRLCGANDIEGIRGHINELITSLTARLDATERAIQDITARLDAMTPSE